MCFLCSFSLFFGELKKLKKMSKVYLWHSNLYDLVPKKIKSIKCFDPILYYFIKFDIRSNTIFLKTLSGRLVKCKLQVKGTKCIWLTAPAKNISNKTLVGWRGPIIMDSVARKNFPKLKKYVEHWQTFFQTFKDQIHPSINSIPSSCV